MWKQTTIGKYTNGVDQIRIQIMSHGHLIVWRNENYEKEFDSIEELNHYLHELGLEPLYVPRIATGENKWYFFGGNEHYDQIYTRKKENGKIESVIVNKFNENDYSIYARETDYECIDCLIEETMEFAEALNRNPENDLELDAYEVGTHGASGMDKWHDDLNDYQEVIQILKEEYNIPI